MEMVKEWSKSIGVLDETQRLLAGLVDSIKPMLQGDTSYPVTLRRLGWLEERADKHDEESQKRDARMSDLMGTVAIQGAAIQAQTETRDEKRKADREANTLRIDFKTKMLVAVIGLAPSVVAAIALFYK
jgi:hypothetical protein